MDRRGKLLLLHSISLSRLGMAVAFVLVEDPWARAALIAASGFSDVLDGWLARRWQLTTPLGAILDPACDRAFVVTVVLTYTFEGRLSPIAAILLLVRDLVVVISWMLSRLITAWRHIHFQARLGGKVVTLLQFLTLFVVLLAPAATRTFVVLTAIASLYALADYAQCTVQNARTPAPPKSEGGRPQPLQRQPSA
jgi:phosphatidylglycerophosphate synthase